MLLSLLLLIVGFAMLIKGADLLVAGSSSVAKRFNISNLAIGLTVVALGTSTPEMLVNVLSAAKGYNDAAFGNVIGSNNFNVLFILGISGLVCPLVVQRNTVKYEIPISLGAAFIMFLLVNDVLLFSSSANMLSRLDAGILLVVFVLFMIYIFRTMRNGDANGDSGEIKIYPGWKAALFIALGLALLIGGGHLVVENAVSIARGYGLSERLIGLTILAAGTSLPELATSVVAAFKRNTDIAIGNVVGSNIFNLLFILGVTGVIHETPYNSALNFDVYVLAAATVFLMVFMFTLHKRKLDRWEALLLVVGYIAYTIYLIMVD